MDPNQTDEEPKNWSDVYDETDLYFMMASYEYQQQLEQEVAQPLLTRNSIYRERKVAEERLMNDYFNLGCKYPHRNFRRRYRMSRKLFLEIVKGIESYTSDPLPSHFAFFSQAPDCTGRMSISVIMKCTSAIRQLANGTAPDAFDEYLQMGEHTSRDCLDNFNKCAIESFMPEYLRKPTYADIQNIYERHEQWHDFLGMLGSIDCMHWEWKNCLVGWQGQYGRGDKRYPTIMLEAVASQDLWILYAFFGVAGTNNDINVLNNSPLFDDIIDDVAPVAPYMVNGTMYENGYYLADGIYPQWATFVKSFTVATDDKIGYFKRKQESARNDVERAFGVIQGRWDIIQQPARQMEVTRISRIMYSCIILNNMILKDQKFALREYGNMWVDPAPRMRQERWVDRCDVQLRKAKKIPDRETHTSLQLDIMEHLWQKHLQRQQQQDSEEDE